MPILHQKHTDTTVFHSIFTNKKGLLTKEFKALDGQLAKESHGVLYSGSVEHAQCCGLSGLLDTIQQLNPSQAIGLGVPKSSKQGESLAICTKNYQKPNAITRSKTNFTFAEGASLVLLDYDPREGESGLSLQDLIKKLLKIYPELEGVGLLALGSASAGVRLDGTPETLQRGGVHIYLIIGQGADVSAFGKWLDVQGWLRGVGYAQISKSGAALKRNLFDISVFDACRLIFEAAPVLGQGVVKPEREVMLIDGDVLDFAKLPELSQSEIDRAKELQDREIQKHKPVIEKNTKAFKRQCIAALQKSGVRQNFSKDMISGLKSNEICAGYTLHSEDESFDVIDLLLNSEKFDEIIINDPFSDKKDKAIFYSNSKLIFSFSKGGYSIRLAKARIHYSINSEIEIMQTLDTLIGFGKHPTIFQRGNEIVAVSDSGEIKPIITSYLQSYFSQFVEFVKTVRGNEVITNPPERFWKAYANRPTCGLPALKNTHSSVIILNAGVHTRRGFIDDCGLFFNQKIKG